MNKDLNFCFSFLCQEYYHSKIPRCMVMRVYYQHRFILTKSSRCTFSQYLPFQSMNRNNRIGSKRCPRLIKKTLVRRKPIVVVHLLGLNKRCTLFEWCYGRFQKASKGPVWYWPNLNAPQTFIMQPTTPLQRTPGKATSKNLKIFLENSRVQ